jgi:hypothetical protein
MRHSVMRLMVSLKQSRCIRSLSFAVNAEERIGTQGGRSPFSFGGQQQTPSLMALSEGRSRLEPSDRTAFLKQERHFESRDSCASMLNLMPLDSVPVILALVREASDYELQPLSNRICAPNAKPPRPPRSGLVQRINIHWPGRATSARITRTVVAPVQCNVWLSRRRRTGRISFLGLQEPAHG